MNLPPPRVFESLHFNHANANSITSPTFLHHQPLVGGNYIMETRVETLGDVCDGKSNSNLEEAFKLSNCTTHENHPHFKLDNLECNSSITSGGVSSGTPSSTESAIINLEGDECMNKSTPSSPLSIAENGSFYGNPGFLSYKLHHIFVEDHTNMEVVLHPDYVVYQDNYYTGTKLCFSQCYIQISDSTACAKQGEGTFEWAVDDLIHIDCLLFPKSGMVVMKLCAVSSNAGPSIHISCTSDKEPDKALKVPCVLHMDSMRGYHSDLKNIFQSYLWEEWKERQKDTCGEDLSSRFLNMHFLSVPSPQQDNMFDCGLFLLHCIELFLDEAPFNFNPFKLTKFSNFLNLDWFHPVEVSLKRPFIQRLIFELAENENHSLHEGFPSDYNEDHRYSENNKNRTNSLRPEVNGDSSLSHSVQGKQFTLLSAPSPLDPQSFNPSDMVLKEHFKPGTMAGTSRGHCQSLDQQSSDHYLNGSIFSTKDGTDLNEELMHIMANPNFQQVSPQSFSLTYLTGGCETEISHGPRIGIQSEHDKIESFIATPSCASGDSDIEIIENFPTRNETRSSYEDERGENNNTAIENYIEQVSDIPGSLMENSQWPNTNCVGHNNGDQHLSYIQSEHSKTKPSQATSTCAYASDDIAMIGNFPIINETRSPYEDEQGEKNNTAIEDYFEHFPEIPDSHMEFSQWPNTSTYASANPDNIAITESFPIRNETGLSYDDQRAEYNNAAMENFFEHLPEIPDSLVEFSQRSNPMCVSDNNGDQGLYCQETPAMQMDQVSNALDDKFTCDDDDLVIIDSMEPDHWKNQPIKKRRMLRSNNGATFRGSTRRECPRTHHRRRRTRHCYCHPPPSDVLSCGSLTAARSPPTKTACSRCHGRQWVKRMLTRVSYDGG
ncbi:hypothetical protein JHK86_004998 [Glycine max]|nr:hypothetical protein JHK86_004998 [Glycine max]